MIGRRTGLKEPRQMHPGNRGIVRKKRRLGNKEKILQTARQGKRERRKALKMIVMMMKTEAVRIAKENPKAGPIAM
jgi:hypothetical protein